MGCCDTVFWKAQDLGHLGLGTMLYLNFMRILSTLFILLGCVTVPCLYWNFQGTRFQSATDFNAIAAKTSLANLAETTFTPGCPNDCNGHGFCRKYCTKWNREEYSYACGSSGSLLPAKAPRSQCLATESKCYCFHDNGYTSGYTGNDCSTALHTGDDPTFIDMCTTGPDQDCNGHGTCYGRKDSERTIGVAFCQCDVGFYGAFCNETDGSVVELEDSSDNTVWKNAPISYADESGTLSSFGSNSKLECKPRACEFVEHSFLNVDFEPQRCSYYGLCIVDPDIMETEGSSPFSGSTPNVKFTHTNYWRPQSPGVCACLPGFSGADCQGGKPPTFSQAIITTFAAVVLFIGVITLYRVRKHMTESFDDDHVTPSDFTVFVDKLPALGLDKIPFLKEHFERLEIPVHYVTPCLDDEKACKLQKKLNAALDKIQIYMEEDEWKRRKELRTRGGAAEGEDISEGPVSLPEVEEDHRAIDVPPQPLSWWRNLLAKLPFGGFVISRKNVYGWAAYLKQKIKEEKAKEESKEFHRAFVTFRYANDKWKAIRMYNPPREISCSRRAPQPEELHFRYLVAGIQHASPIKVTAAVEPGEVVWPSLDVGFLQKVIRVIVSYTVVLLFTYGLFNVVVLLKGLSNRGGFLALLSPVVVLILNKVAAVTFRWFSTFEQHYNLGSQMRSLYIKTLTAQMLITGVAGVLATYGLPADPENGYRQEWFYNAGAFVIRLILIESFLPPFMNLTQIVRRIKLCLKRNYKSEKKGEIMHYPPQFSLPEKCAGMMRTVLVGCAFSPGMPILNWLVAIGLLVRYFSDKYAMEKIFQLFKLGPQLCRVLELTLALAVVLNVLMVWVVMGPSVPDYRYVTYGFIGFGFIGWWCLAGYFSWKYCRGRDCWCGSGVLIPCSRLCARREQYRRSCNPIHEVFMKLVFGSSFFSDYHESSSANYDETGGKPFNYYADGHDIRILPYYYHERNQLFGQEIMDHCRNLYSFDVFVDLEEPKPMTAKAFKEYYKGDYSYRSQQNPLQSMSNPAQQRTVTNPVLQYSTSHQQSPSHKPQGAAGTGVSPYLQHAVHSPQHHAPPSPHGYPSPGHGSPAHHQPGPYPVLSPHHGAPMQPPQAPHSHPHSREYEMATMSAEHKGEYPEVPQDTGALHAVLTGQEQPSAPPVPAEHGFADGEGHHQAHSDDEV